MTCMGRLTGAVVSGLIFGAVAVALMLPMQFPDKRTALLDAIANRESRAAVAEFPLFISQLHDCGRSEP